jgi:putative endopeptidase
MERTGGRRCKPRCTVAVYARMSNLPRRILSTGALLGAAVGTIGAQQRQQSPMIQRAYLDTTCSPCTDFWRFANGAWVDSARIPPDRGVWGRDAGIRERNEIVIRALLDSLAFAPTRHARTPLERNVGVFFRSCMDSTSSAAEELRPLQPELRRLAAIRTRSDVSAAIGRLTREGLSPLFWFVVTEEIADTRRTFGDIRGLFGWSMPSRQAYLLGDTASVRIRDAYVAMLTRVFALLGDPAEVSAANARHVLALETAIARAQPRDSGGPNEKRTIAELQQLAPAFDWRAFAEGLGRPNLPPLFMRTEIRTAIDSLIAVVPAEQWTAYLRWKYALSLAQMLPKSVGGEFGGFFRLATGRQGVIPRPVQCVTATTLRLGGGVARAYVARSFSAADRAAALALVERMRSAFREGWRTLDWVQPETRRRAIAKLDAMKLWIGYPDVWDDYSGLVLRDGPAASVFLAVRRFQMDDQIAKLGAPVDAERWIESNPAFVDLTYFRGRNALFISAAALQAPAFDARADVITNIAGIGWGIGHELSHGFDSGGRLHNETGKREDWWVAQDAQEYARRAELVVRQYNQYVIIDSIRQNGRRTLAENIADIGAAAIAYQAFKGAAAGEADEVVGGFSREQRFFIAFAQSFPRSASRPQALRLQAETDNHSVAQWRLNGALANLPAFAAAFGCKEGDPMVLPASLRGSIW